MTNISILKNRAMPFKRLLNKLFPKKAQPLKRVYADIGEIYTGTTPVSSAIDLSKSKTQLVKEAIVDLYGYGYTHCTSKMIFAYLDGALTVGEISKCLYRLGQRGFINNTQRLSTIADSDRSGLYWTLSKP